MLERAPSAQFAANVGDPGDSKIPLKRAPKIPKTTRPDLDFKLSDVQTYYDMQLIQGSDEDDALDATLEKFDLPEKDVAVTPVGLLTVKGLEPELPHPDDAVAAAAAEKAKPAPTQVVVQATPPVKAGGKDDGEASGEGDEDGKDDGEAENKSADDDGE